MEPERSCAGAAVEGDAEWAVGSAIYGVGDIEQTGFHFARRVPDREHTGGGFVLERLAVEGDLV